MHFKLQLYDSLILGKRLILFPSCENDFKILILSKPTLEKVYTFWKMLSMIISFFQ